MGDTIAFVAVESPVSDFEGVIDTIPNCLATVNYASGMDASLYKDLNLK